MSVVSRLTYTRRSLVVVCVMANLAAAPSALAQSGPEATEAAPAASVVHEDDDAVLRLAEPDFVVVNLPTTLRLPRFKSNFRLTHRFAGNLRNGRLGQLRLGSSTYVAGEIASRVQGYAPDQPGYGVSLEKRVGAHMFSLTFTNTFATTFAQLARGGAANSLYLGFNLGRKFF